MVNEGELPEQYYPLRLVGIGLENSQMIGQITRITVNVPPAVHPHCGCCPGKFRQPDHQGNGEPGTHPDGCRPASDGNRHHTAEGKNGPQDFQGVLLNPLLDQAGLKDGATKLVFTASDNYSAEVNLSDVRDCPKALLAFMDTPGMYMIVLPDQPTSTWVKNVILIEVK